MPAHVALLGDSIFDNRSYVGNGPDVVTQLRDALPNGWKASLLAVDGSVIGDLPQQLAQLEADVSEVAVSLGGNDVLGEIDLLGARVGTATEALLKLGEAVAWFERSYRGAVASLRDTGRSITLCTIYNGNLPDMGPGFPDPHAARMALTAFNDVILRVAFELGLDVIDLRLVCNEAADYANPIEPSSRGGEKIARAIVRALGLTQTPARRTQVFY